MSDIDKELSVRLWRDYADIFRRRWGIEMKSAAYLGAESKSVFAAEFRERGARAYRDSIILPIRNAAYACTVVRHRWRILQGLDLKPPILDYGCGVGVTAIWLKMKGLDSCGYELPGVQRKVMKDAFKMHGVGEWHGGPVETVLCLNVLEHVRNPLALLRRLQKIGKRVVANPGKEDDDHLDEPHIAPRGQLEKCRAIMEAEGGLFVSDYSEIQHAAV